MPVRLSDAEIAALIQERKVLPPDYLSRIQLRAKRGHREAAMDVAGDGGQRFRVILRQSASNALDFSAILAFCPPTTNRLFLLRRYNGRSHEHTNLIERDRFSGFHVHTATERYQQLGADEDAYAEPTDRYADLRAALQCMFEDCGFAAEGGQLGLFPGYVP